MPTYSNIEYRDMLYIYGFVDGNSEKARREYARRFPDRLVPNAKTFVEVYRLTGETGSFQGSPQGEGGKNAILNPSTVAVLQTVRRDPTTSTRRIGSRLSNILGPPIAFYNKMIYTRTISREFSILWHLNITLEYSSAIGTTIE